MGSGAQATAEEVEIVVQQYLAGGTTQLDSLKPHLAIQKPGPRPSWAILGGFGLAQVLSKPKPPQAKPKLQLLGAGPEHHYT